MSKLTLADLTCVGPPIRLTQLAHVAGYSLDKVHRDARAGYLKTFRDENHPKSPRMVTRDEARRWLRTMGLLLVVAV